MNGAKKMVYFGLVFLFLGSVACLTTIAQTTSAKTEAELKREEKARAAEKLKDKREAAAKDKREAAAKARQEAVEKAKAKLKEQIAKLNLPQDTTPRLTVKELRISGNTLISTDELLKDMPLVYNASDRPLEEAESGYLYDLRILHDVILQPGQPRQVSTRTIQGFTQYILSAYQDKNYAGIYVYVPAEALREGAELEDGLLPVEVLEAKVTKVDITMYDVERKEKEKGFLRSSLVLDWSPVKVGQTANQKKLDDFINLLNLNPDRYVSATVSRGAEPKSLAVGYDIYEANPWHYYLQVDNSGTSDRQWAPRIGLINTNLTGRDDRLTLMAQVPFESNFEDNYAAYGSYEFPLWTPRLRLNVFGGRSEFDIDGGGGITFLGNGSFYGGMLRFNAFQTEGWFFDLTTSLTHEESKVSSSIFNQILGSEVEFDLWGIGVNIHRSDDMSNTSLAFDRIQSVDASSQNKFWDSTAFTGARRNSDRDFTIYTISAAHSQFLDPDKIQRLSGSFRSITSNERLVPAKMTTFGGLYTVRGYKESRIVADGGQLLSGQYEFDLVKYDESKEIGGPRPEKRPFLRKLAPLVFFDYGRARIKDPVPGEKRTQELYSAGIGTLVELGDHFSAGAYLGWPLKSATGTEKGQERLSISLIMRW